MWTNYQSCKNSARSYIKPNLPALHAVPIYDRHEDKKQISHPAFIASLTRTVKYDQATDPGFLSHDSVLALNMITWQLTRTAWQNRPIHSTYFTRWIHVFLECLSIPLHITSCSTLMENIKSINNYIFPSLDYFKRRSVGQVVQGAGLPSLCAT